MSTPAIIPPAPELGALKSYLPLLPPMIARKRVPFFTGGAISSKKLANDDWGGKGPKVRQKIGDAVVYPTPFFLAYLESQGVTTIVVPKI
ncbi:hypothetical protein [Desulfovibrio sp. 86]|uniref:Uncharacterized protein n=1 Tax=uncultured Desulfovibrio sp. TaxID=167968 RepID=A0A212KXV8_9BACT|nr:hypothetical protein [Desulfovibrio sp. 86]SCM69969.1 conserved hypothetical protein [uncultured Desulfovibrio sp.]VZH35304.1 conserved protein of unknown function [Desulfovibrio sp. 86]